MNKTLNFTVSGLCGLVVLVILAGCATSTKRGAAGDETSELLGKLQIIEQPELEPDWADWVKERYPNWREHYWVDRGQWGNRGYVFGRATTPGDPFPPPEITPLPPLVDVPTIVDEPAPVVETPARPTTYTVKKGDSLWKIAGKVYRNPLKWPRIYRANKDQIKNPHKIYPGQVLTIPWE